MPEPPNLFALQNDLQMFGPEDRLIAVMGVTGSGKSTLISLLTGDEDVKIGHSLVSCTSDPCPYLFILKDGRRVFFLDTPGFDDTNKSDTEVLRSIAYYLTRIYKQSIHLDGIIYLHRITDVRMQGSSLKNLNLLKALCGPDAYNGVVLASTMWESIGDREVGEYRERYLVDKLDWWGAMKQGGSKVARHDGTEASALSIIDKVLHGNTKIILNIQRELVDEGRSLDMTEAGRIIDEEVQSVKQMHQNHKLELEQQYMEAVREHDSLLASALGKQSDEYEKRFKQAMQAQRDLHIDLARLEQENRDETGRLELNAYKSVFHLERMQMEKEAELEILQKRSEKTKPHVPTESPYSSEQLKIVHQEDEEQPGSRRRRLQRKHRRDRRRREELLNDVKAIKIKKMTVLRVVISIISLGLAISGAVSI